MAGLDPPVLTRVALDGVASHEVEDEVRGASDDLGQARAALRAEQRFELARIELQPGNHLTAIPAGRPRTDLARLEHHDGGAALDQVQRRRQAGEPTADDADVRAVLALERQGRGGWRRGRRPEGRRREPDGGSAGGGLHGFSRYSKSPLGSQATATTTLAFKLLPETRRS